MTVICCEKTRHPSVVSMRGWGYLVVISKMSVLEQIRSSNKSSSAYFDDIMVLDMGR